MRTASDGTTFSVLRIRRPLSLDVVFSVIFMSLNTRSFSLRVCRARSRAEQEPVARALTPSICVPGLFEPVDYLHRGRHTVREGEQRGEFPVDHGDARFALAMTRLLVAQTSRLLSEGSV